MKSELAIITAALRKNPEGIRCCVASTDPQFKAFQRGETGTLSIGPGKTFCFTPDDKANEWNWITFSLKEWSGLHIPSLNIIRE